MFRKSDDLPWWMHPSFRPAGLQNLVLWVNSSSRRGDKWYNIAPVYGNRNHGTLHGTSRDSSIHPSGKFGSGVSFDGADDYVDCGNDPSLNITDAITIDVRAKTGDVKGNEVMLDKGYWESYTFRKDTSGSLRIGLRINGIIVDYVSGGYIPDDQWHHLITTYDGVQIISYFDGNAVGSPQSAPGSIDTTTNNLRIGAATVAEYKFIGTIDEVKIYNRALSANEVKQNYMHSVYYYIERGIDPLRLLR